MNIALVAQDVKKELMVRFCIAYCGVLSTDFFQNFLWRSRHANLF